jgi:hypothetical protein
MLQSAGAVIKDTLPCCCWCLQVVPTEYVDLKGVSTNSNQFSVTENFRESADAHLGGRSLPGVFFFYDLSPIKVGALQEAVVPIVNGIT